jgi:hypothetical protein
MSVSDLMTSLRQEVEKRVYFTGFDVLEESYSLLKGSFIHFSQSICTNLSE